MGKKLFVGNLAWSVREDGLRQFVEDKGIVCENVEVILERDTDRSKGFGFLHFATDAAAAEALKVLNNVELDGRDLHVEPAMSSGDSGKGRRPGGSGGRRSSGRHDDYARDDSSRDRESATRGSRRNREW
jgi:cold-inducible RNA-binding protein